MATVLGRGSKSAAVRAVQLLLNQLGATPPLTIDGDFGEKTEIAVRAFQERFGLLVDGKVGENTRTALKRAAAPAKRPTHAEPDKSAMADAVHGAAITDANRAAPPPNAASLRLIDTARPIDEIIIHCAATPEGKSFTVADIRAWHKARGWSDIGYHYVIYLDGGVMVGRPIGQIGAHVAGHNTGTIGICYIGGVSADGRTAKDTRTDAQRTSTLWLTETLADKFGVRKVTGHNQYSAKACPSFDVRRDPLGAIAA